MSSNAPIPIRSTRQATAREFFEVLFRRKWLIAGLFVATTITVVVLAFSTPVTYSSSGRVLVKRGERLSAINPGRQLFGDWENDLASELEVARSQPVIAKARAILAEQTRAGQPPVKLEAGSVDAEVMGKSTVLGIAYSDLDPAVSRRVCDALITSYIEFRREQVEIQQPQEFFDRELARVDAQIQAKMDERERLSLSSGVLDGSGQPQQVLSELGMYKREQSLAEADLAAASAEQGAMRELASDPSVDLPTMGSLYTNEGALVELKKRIVDQEARIATLRERYRDDSPEVLAANETLETLRGLLRREVESRLRVAGSRIQTLQARLDVVNRAMAELEAQKRVLPSAQMTLEQLDADVRTLRDRYRELALEADKAKITEHTSDRVSVVLLSPAGPPVAQNTRDYVRLALAPAFSLVVGIGLAFFIDGLDLTVRTANQAEEYLEVPVLASLSERRKRG